MGIRLVFASAKPDWSMLEAFEGLPHCEEPLGAGVASHARDVEPRAMTVSLWPGRLSALPTVPRPGLLMSIRSIEQDCPCRSHACRGREWP
jgi:hypothetical protein